MRLFISALVWLFVVSRASGVPAPDCPQIIGQAYHSETGALVFNEIYDFDCSKEGALSAKLKYEDPAAKLLAETFTTARVQGLPPFG